jgi:hypothetical protein
MGIKVRKNFTRTKGRTWVEMEELWENGEDLLNLSLLMSYIYGAPSKARNLTSYIYGRDFLLGILLLEPCISLTYV